MSWSVLFLIFLIVLFAFFFLGQKVAFALGLASLAGFYLTGDLTGLQMVGRAVWKSAVYRAKNFWHNKYAVTGLYLSWLECLLDMQEVTGSSPVSPIILCQ